jgi:hypothetical protein
MAISGLIIRRFLYICAGAGLVAYFLYDYGVVTGSWVVGALLYVGCLLLLVPAAREIRQNGISALHWLDWVRLAFIPAFAASAAAFASWLPLFTISVLGLCTSVFVLIVTGRRRPDALD